MTASSLATSALVRLTSPSPAPAEVVNTPDPELVTPGTLGFLAVFGVAVVLVFLVRDMVRRNRGIVVRSERRDAALAATGEAGPGDDVDAPPGRDGGTGPRPEGTTPPGDPGSRDRRGPAAPTG